MPPSGSMHTAQTAYPMTIDLREAAVKVFFFLFFAKVWSPRMHQMMLCEQPMQRELRVPSNSFHARNAQLIY